MKKYTEPILTLLIFDEVETITTSAYDYSANVLNEVMMSDSVGMPGIITIPIEQVNVN